MKYDLAGLNRDAFKVMAYVRKALRESGNEDMIENYMSEVTSGDYSHLLDVSMEYINIANLLK